MMHVKIGSIFTMALALGCLFSQVAMGTEENTISTTGTADIERKPDISYVTLYVKGDGILMADAIKRAREKSEAIQKAIKENHKGIKEVEITDIEIGEKGSRYWSSEKEDEPPRPQVTKRMRITIPPDQILAHQIIDTAIREGAVMQIPSSTHYSGELHSIVIYGLLDASAAEDEAKKKAFEDAKTKAQEMAALASKKIGDVVSISCGRSITFPGRMYISGRQADFPTEYVGIDPNKIDISYSLSVTFQLLK
jgi:uncharacterized protein YggE